MTDVKTLSQLKEELDPQGAKVDKDDYLGMPLAIKKLKPFMYKGKQAIRVIFADPETGELCHFSGGEPMYNSVKEALDHTPFVAQVVSYQNTQGDPYYILE